MFQLTGHGFQTKTWALPHLSETWLLEIWQSALRARTDLASEDGEPIRILYPGRHNDDHGADVVDAIIATSERLLKGDIEFHIRSSSWYAHRHHQDPCYNNTILHVVFCNNGGLPIATQNGQEVLTLALDRYLSPPADQVNIPHQLDSSAIPCCQKSACPDYISAFLDKAGEQRFFDKAARFEKDLAQSEAKEVLYQGIMGALGYARNKLPCLEVARRLPLRVLETLVKNRPDQECLIRQQSLLLGTAGLLPSQRSNRHCRPDDEWISQLERFWSTYDHNEPMSENDWHQFRNRPSNLPVRRIIAMSHLILRYREKGILDGLISKVEMTVKPDWLERELTVTTEGYWANHFDFGLASRQRILTLIGRGRAAEIIVNVLLPFAFTWGKLISKPSLSQKSFELFCGYPRLEINTLERHMRRQLGLSNQTINSARRQQGLIHIYKNLCSEGKCYCCPLVKR